MTAVSAFIAISVKEGPIRCDEPYFFRQGYAPDAFEYHTMAANLTLHGCFPYYGFMSSMSDYHLSDHPDSVTYFRDTQRSGAIVFDNKPPLYPLLLGLTYKTFGFNPCTAAYFNLLCLIALISLMPIAGFLINEIPGAICGVLAAFAFMCIRNFKLWYFTPEILTTFLVMVVLCAGILAFRKNTIKRYALLGFSLSLLALCKGMFLVTLILVSVYLLYLIISRRTVRYLIALISLDMSAAVLIISWMAYINPMIQGNVKERLAFYSSLKATSPKIMFEKYSQLFDSTGHTKSEVIESLNKFHQYEHAIENGRVVITNQFGNYDILNVHNEYCLDGDFHPEWLLIRNSFYNRHSNLSQFQKMLLFYQENPILGIRIAWAKVRAIFGLGGYIFYMAIICSLLLAPVHRYGRRWIVGLALLLNILIIQILVYADIRFVDSVAPVSVLYCTLSLGWIVSSVYGTFAFRRDA